MRRFARRGGGRRGSATNARGEEEFLQGRKAQHDADSHQERSVVGVARARVFMLPLRASEPTTRIGEVGAVTSPLDSRPHG